LHSLYVLGSLTDSMLQAATSAVQTYGDLQDDKTGPGMKASESYEVSRPNTERSQPSLGDQPCVLVQQPGACILWKPAGWTVTVGMDKVSGTMSSMFEVAGEEDEELGTQVLSVGQLHVRETFENPLQDWLMKGYGHTFAITRDEDAQHGLLHRLDKDTSGVMAWATSYRTYYEGKLQFYLRRTKKSYVCLCHGHLPPTPREFTALLAVELTHRGKRAVVSKEGSMARTEVCSVAHFWGPDGAAVSMVNIKLHTGKMHQIRAHLNHEGFPLVGDKIYGSQRRAWCPRIFLHAYSLSLDMSEGLLHTTCGLPLDLMSVLDNLCAADGPAQQQKERWFCLNAPDTGHV